MKTQLMLIILFLSSSLFAQEIVEKKFDLTTKREVELKLKFADDIIITKSHDSFMHFKARINIENGELNNAHEIEFDENQDEVQIETDIDHNLFKNSKYRIKEDDGDCYHYDIDMDIVYEIKIPEDIKVELETISGNIEIKGLTGPMKINSISGFVDLTWGNAGADLELSTITGEIYSNLEIDKKNYDKNSVVGSSITAEYRGGGIPLEIETISSDIYLRKE